MGTPEFAAVILSRLLADEYSVVAVVSQPDKPSGRKMKLLPTPVKMVAEAQEIPVLQPVKVRTAEFEEELRSYAPDLIVTAAYGRILPASILEIPAHGCLNVHGSLLPDYRGSAPVQRAILRGDTKTGVTVMKMDEGMDTGEMVRRAEVPIPGDMDAVELMSILAERGAQLLSDVLPSYLAGEIVLEEQDDARATHAPMIERAQGLIDWSASAAVIHNQIRGLAIWPGTHTFLNGSRVKMYTSSLEVPKELLTMGDETPGTIIKASGGDLVVACGVGSLLRILSLQPESGRRMDARDCAHNYRVGDRFVGC